MSENIITALITGSVTLLGVLISNSRRQGIIETKIEELTREVREHNNFAKRMPVVEKEVEHINDDIKALQKFHERG